jgi:hypothetical protein
MTVHREISHKSRLFFLSLLKNKTISVVSVSCEISHIRYIFIICSVNFEICKVVENVVLIL